MKEKPAISFECPKCKCGDLIVNSVEQYGCDQSYVKEGILGCNSCNELFPVLNGIPRLVSIQNYASSFGFQWNIHTKTQLDSYTGLEISRNRLFSVTGWPEQMQGERILEAGSGAGRFTEVLLSTGADLYSFDYSSAVEANFANNGNAPNLTLFQGDIFNIPFDKRNFDKVFCLGVIQHTPDPELAFKCLADHVKPGGELVVDVYNKRLVSMVQWKYLLRPITKRMNKVWLYKFISFLVSILLPLTIILRRGAGRFGARFAPIVQYSHLGLPYNLNKQWAILDTFDMYSPAHDHPQSISTVRRWYEEAGFFSVEIGRGPNGVIAKGHRPE